MSEHFLELLCGQFQENANILLAVGVRGDSEEELREMLRCTLS